MSKIPDTKASKSTQTDSRADSKTETKTAGKTASAAAIKPTTKAASATSGATTAEARPDATGDDKTASGSAGKSAAQPETKSETKPEAKSNAKQPGKSQSGAGAASTATGGGSGKATPPKPSTSSPASRSGGFTRGVLVNGVVMIGVVVAAGLTIRDWWPIVEPYLPVERASADAEAIEALDVRLADLERSSGSNATLGSDVATLRSAQQALETRLGDLARQIESAETAISALRSSIAAGAASGSGADGAGMSEDMMQRLGALEAALETAAQDQAALNAEIETLQATRNDTLAANAAAQTMALVVGQIRSSVASGEGFSDSLAQLGAISGDDPVVADAVAAMTPHAASGVATLDELRRDLDRRASDIARAGSNVEGDDWTAQAINSLQSLITVRRLDGEDPTTVDGRLVAAEAALSAGNLADAVAALEGLEGAALEAARAWLDRAQARLAVDGALATLQAHTIALLTSDGG